MACVACLAIDWMSVLGVVPAVSGVLVDALYDFSRVGGHPPVSGVNANGFFSRAVGVIKTLLAGNGVPMEGKGSSRARNSSVV